MTERKTNPVTAVLISILITLAGCAVVTFLQIPNPMILLISGMLICFLVYGMTAGLISDGLLFVYALWRFSTGHSFISYTPVDLNKVIVIAAALVLNSLVVIFLNRRYMEQRKKLVSAVEDLHQANLRLLNESDMDPLTGVYNRRGGDAMLRKYFNITREPAVLAALDLDNFKRFNDVYGHAVGDLVLEKISEEMEKFFPEETVFIRNGGDEFQMFFPHTKEEEIKSEISAFAARTFTVRNEDQDVEFHVSIGYALYPEQGVDVNEVASKADSALYYVKMNGKGGAALYDMVMDSSNRVQLGFNLMDISSGIPVAVLVYRADESQEILFATQSLIDLFDCSSLRDFLEFTNRSFRNMVCEEDRDRIEKEIETQLASNSGTVDTLEYRIRTKTGQIRNIHDLGRLVENRTLGKLFYVVLYDRDDMKGTKEGS